MQYFRTFFLTSEKFPSFENLMNIVDDDGMCCSRWSFRTAWSAEMKVTCLYVGKSHSKFITRITSVMTHLASSTATDSFWAWTPRDSVFANDFQGFKNIHLTYNLYAITRLNSDNFSRFRMRGNIIFSLSSYDRTRENIQKNLFFLEYSWIFLNKTVFEIVFSIPFLTASDRIHEIYIIRFLVTYCIFLGMWPIVGGRGKADFAKK